MLAQTRTRHLSQAVLVGTVADAILCETVDHITAAVP